MVKKAVKKAKSGQLAKRKSSKKQESLATVNRSSQNQLVTTFHCADCGHPVTLVHKISCAEANLTPIANTLMAISKPEYTLYNQISIKPCKPCMEKVTGPAQAIAQALKTLGNTDIPGM